MRAGPYIRAAFPRFLVIPGNCVQDEVSAMNQDLPLGFSFALSQRPEAMERFAALTEPERQAVIDDARSAQSKQEMRACVERLMG